MALGVADAPDRGSSEISRNEICHESLSSDDAYFVEISPGSPNDFTPGAQIIGTTAERVEGVGNEAVWYGGTDADDNGAYGVIMVHQETQHGDLYFRILLGRPDIDEAQQREIAIDLAQKALPRFPGVVIAKDPVPQDTVTFEEEDPPDTAHLDLAENLLVKEARGDWSRGDGLIATLGYMTGDVEKSEVLGDIDVLDDSASPVIELARLYAESENDPAKVAEVLRLLDVLTLTPAELQATGNKSLLVSAVPLAQEDPDPCLDPQSTDPCFDQIPLPPIPGVPDNKYTLWADLVKGTQWTVPKIDAAKQAIRDSALKYESLGEMPAVLVILKPNGTTLYVDYLGEECVLYLDGFLAEFDNDEFRQIIAREMGFCLIAAEFNQTIKADVEGTKWWTRGLVNYLSGYVYPSINLEHQTLPNELALSELSTTLADRTWTNWVLFEYLHGLNGGAKGNMDLVRTFPPGGDHLAQLAAAPGMEELYHDFERALTDANVSDLGPGTVPYQPRAWQFPIVAPVEAKLFLPALGVRRLHITVPDGMYACFETIQQGDQRTSWRSGAPGVSGTWEEDPPFALEGETTLVATAVTPGATMIIDVTDVTDDPDCKEDEDTTPTTLGDCGVCPPSAYYYKD